MLTIILTVPLNGSKIIVLYCASESTQRNATWVVFLSLFSCKFDDQLSLNVHRFVILCICWDISQVRRLIFDNTKRAHCPVPLMLHKNKLVCSLNVKE